MYQPIWSIICVFMLILSTASNSWGVINTFLALYLYATLLVHSTITKLSPHSKTSYLSLSRDNIRRYTMRHRRKRMKYIIFCPSYLQLTLWAHKYGVHFHQKKWLSEKNLATGTCTATAPCWRYYYSRPRVLFHPANLGSTFSIDLI